MQRDTRSNEFTSLLLIGLLFSIFGFVTWLNGTLIKFLQTACQLNNSQATWVTFAFFISYFIMAIPSSAILKKTGFKNGMMMGLIIMAVGCLLFIPAAHQRNYVIFLAGLFTQGLGLTILQTASNPYVTIVGPIESAAKRISIMGICNKLAGAIGAYILAKILLDPLNSINKTLEAMTDASQKAILLSDLSSKIIQPYTIMAVFLIIVAIAIRFSPLPDVKEEDEKADQNQLVQRPLGAHTYLFLGVLAIFVYVGVEVLAGDYIIKHGTYLLQGTSFEKYANYLTSVTLIFMLAGYGAGVAVMPRIITQETALRINATCGIILATGVVFLPGYASIFCLAFLGFFHAIMWPAIWPMSISNLGKYTKIGSAFLIMGIAGGAIIPQLNGYLQDMYGGNIQKAFWIMIPCYVYLLFFAIKGYKMGRIDK